MKRYSTKLKIFLSVVFLIGFVVNGVFITIYNVDKSVNIGEVTSQISDLRLKANKLNESISSEDSLLKFIESSGSLGYGESEDILYFNQEEAVAQVR